MNHLQKLRTPSVLKWVSFNFCKTPVCENGSYSYYYIPQNPRFYSPKTVAKTDDGQDLDETNIVEGGNGGRLISRVDRQEAQAALLEYLHSTRNLQFMDAENMSRNSPLFLDKLLKKIDNEMDDVGRSITRFLRYHPINEFEPFFESVGLKPNEYSPLLPRNLMFLNEDERLLENYYALRDYGIARNNIGKIYKEVAEVFRYDYGVLLSKLQTFEKVGLTQSIVVKIVASSPYVLIDKANRVLFKVLEKLKSIGVHYGWIEKQLLEGNSYNWGRMLELLCSLNKIGCTKEQLKGLIMQNPGLLFEGSGSTTSLLIGFLVKFGATSNDLSSMFINFPQLEVEKYFSNLRQCYHFLVEIEMDEQEIGRIVRSRPGLLGSCYLKKLNSLLVCLNTGRKRVCEIIIKNPQELRNWVLGSRVKPLPNTRGDKLLLEKTAFLLGLGFIENSTEMEKALKLFRGKGTELQERFDCFINAGLTRTDVAEMLKNAPQIINQTKEVIEMKIDFLVNELGQPISSLIAFPAYISYTTQRVSLRYLMYNWLKDQGRVDPNLALSTIIACSDKIFIKQYVNHHPSGLVVWEKLKKQIYSE